MERKSLPSLLEPKHEYTYEEAFRIYDESGRAACAEENKKIARENAKKLEKVTASNKERERQTEAKNTQSKKEAEALNSKAKKSRLIKVAIISFIVALVLSIAAAVVFIVELPITFVVIMPITFVVLMLIIKPKHHWANYEEPEKEELSETASKNYTFLPSGIIQCSSCGTKTKIDTKDATSTCPNCRSEIFVISDMEDNVTVKTMARSKTGE